MGGQNTEIILLQRQAIAEGWFCWSLSEEECAKLVLTPFLFHYGSRLAGYALVLTLDEASQFDIFRPLVSETKCHYKGNLKSVCLLAQVYIMTSARRGGSYSRFSRIIETSLRTKGFDCIVGGIRRWNQTSLSVHTGRNGQGWKIISIIGNGHKDDWFLVAKFL